MFNKKNNHFNKINNKVNQLRNLKVLGDPNFTKITIFTLSICLALFLLLPHKLQILLQRIIRHPIILVSILIFCLLVGFINISVSISLIIFISTLFFFNNNSVFKFEEIEGFKDGEIKGFKNGEIEGFKVEKESNKEEDEITNKIKDLFSGGSMVKSFNEGNEELKKLKHKEKAENNMLKLEVKKNKKSESFENTSKENFKPIPMRKFNPADKEDTDLLLVMDYCKDISNRIKYEYENTRYLKKYIKDKIEEIIDTLDLIEED